MNKNKGCSKSFIIIIILCSSNDKVDFGITNRLRLPENAIDDIGIAPVYYLDNIPNYKWVEFVNEMLSSK